jgi:hypothetical protein
MNAALRLTSGDGELEKGWNRLFGSNKGRPEVSGTGVDARPGGLRISGGSAFAVCPCWLLVDADLLPKSVRGSSCVEALGMLTIEPFLAWEDILLLHKSDVVLCADAKPTEDRL